MSDDLVKRLRCPPFGTETSERNLMEEAAAEITRLRAAIGKARREGMEEAAKWHDEQAARAQKLADMKVSALDAKVWGDYAANHREYAAAIRAVAGEGK